jgi:succinyl-CoA synthetase alpha subunit
MLTNKSTCILYGNHLDVLQRMLDYDFLCGREPSVVAIMVADQHPRGVKVFRGATEMIVPQINSREQAMTFSAKVLINFASFRTAPSVIEQALETELFEYIFTVAEGIPERATRELIALQKKYPKTMLIWPSVVWGIVCGVLRVGNTGGSRENIMQSHLWQAGSVGLVTKSGGMMNELCRVVSHHTDGVHTALQVGWDRYPMSRFGDIVRLYEATPEIKMIVLLGEVGNEDELEVAELIKKGVIKKPIVAWVSGTVAEELPSEVQFGHAWAKANSQAETATYKNKQLREAGVWVPERFDDFGTIIATVFQEHVGKQIMRPNTTEIEKKLSIINNRRPTRFTSTISDERGEELLYNHIPVQQFVQEGSLGKVIGHLWLKKELPDYAARFLEMVLILLADHGPAVSGAMNTIITARAGKDLVSSLIAWLATIWPRFWWAIDGSAQWLFAAIQQSKTAQLIIDEHKQKGQYIQWIGHRVKSIHHPDTRCVLLRELAEQFSVRTHLDLALQVEALTSMKKPNLILNVDGHVAAMLLDIFVDIGLSSEEINQNINAGLFNGLFVLARTIGFIGHYLDQQRLDEGLYRTSREDIWYRD